MHNPEIVRLYSDIQTEELKTGSLPRPIPDALSTLMALCIGVVTTLCVCGYQFGKSNHTIYLLDAFHRTHAPLLDNDWFTTQTFRSRSFRANSRPARMWVFMVRKYPGPTSL